MRKLTIIGRAIRFGMQGFVRHIWLTTAAVLVMTISLAIVLSTIVIYFSTQSAVREISRHLEQTVYLREGVSVAETIGLQQEIIANPAVVDIDFVTPSEGRDIVIASDPELAEAFAVFGDEDVLLPAIRVTLDDIDQIDVVRQIATDEDYDDLVASLSIDESSLARETVDRARSIRDFAVMSSIVLSLVFAGVACLIIFNTIQIAIFSRRQEIEVMRLVGARSEFVRVLFVVESCLAGLLAGLLAVGLVYGVFVAGGDWIAAQPELAYTHELFQRPQTFIQMTAGSILGGVIAGLVSSYWATRRYLKLLN